MKCIYVMKKIILKNKEFEIFLLKSFDYQTKNLDISLFNEEELKKINSKRKKETLLCMYFVKLYFLKKENKLIFIRHPYLKKPYLIDAKGKTLTMNFNLSHSNNHVAIIFSEKNVGIDIEFLRRRNIKYANYVLNEEELLYLKEWKKSQLENDALLLKVWSRKEAFAKLLGKGLLFDFKSITVLSKKGLLNKIKFNNNVYSFYEYSFDDYLLIAVQEN